jgi:hypothetical protein
MFGLKIVNSKAAKAAIEREQDMLNKFAEFEVKVSQSNEL